MSINYNQYLGARKCCDIKVQGPQGPQGAQGPSSIGQMGYQGATGVQGYQGATGRGCRGATGAQGYQGNAGPQGATGIIGPQGATGIIGLQGATGVIGPQGATGVIGPQGVTGAQGTTGPGGVLGFFGAFHSEIGQTAASINTPYNILAPIQDYSNGITIDSSGNITISHIGVYNIQFSAQLTKSSGNAADILIWLYANGNNIAWTNTDVTINGSNAKEVASWNWFYQTTIPNEIVSIKWQTTNTDVVILVFGDNVQ